MAYARRDRQAEMPGTLNARTQNEGWERGRIDLARRYVPQLSGVAVKDRSKCIAALDAIFNHLVPPLSVLIVATGGVAAAGSALSIVRRSGWGGAARLACGALAGHVVSGLVLARAPLDVYRSLFHASPSLTGWAWCGRRGR